MIRQLQQRTQLFFLFEFKTYKLGIMYFTKLSILCIVLCLELNTAFPQKWKSFSNSNQGFNWQGKDSKSSGRGYGSDSDAEMISSNILEEHQVNTIWDFLESDGRNNIK